MAAGFAPQERHRPAVRGSWRIEERGRQRLMLAAALITGGAAIAVAICSGHGYPKKGGSVVLPPKDVMG